MLPGLAPPGRGIPGRGGMPPGPTTPNQLGMTNPGSPVFEITGTSGSKGEASAAP